MENQMVTLRMISRDPERSSPISRKQLEMQFSNNR